MENDTMNAAKAGLDRGLHDQVLRVAEKLRGRLAPGSTRTDIADALEQSLVAKGHAVRRMVWVPERCASLRLNCGYLVDLLVDGATALFLETENSAAAAARKHIPRCLETGGFAEGVLLHFGDELRTHTVAAPPRPALDNSHASP